MSRIEVEKSFAFFHVDFDFLERIEEFFLQRIPALLGHKGAKAKHLYSFEIIDRFGAEAVETITAYKHKYLPDSITEINFVLKNEKANLDIHLNITRDQKSLLKIEIDEEDARSKAKSIIAELKEIIRNYKNGNRLFHPPQFVQLGIGLTGFWFFLMAFESAKPSKIPEAVGYGLLTASIVTYFLIGMKIRTISTFHTKKYQTQNRYYKWFVSSALSFLFFGVFLTFLRDLLIKYFLNN